MIVAFIAGLIGGCSGSSSGALTVFRVQLALRAMAIRSIRSVTRIGQTTYGMMGGLLRQML